MAIETAKVHGGVVIAQCNASMPYTYGGAPDFTSGALHARGGQSFVALPSWHPKVDVSTIVPALNIIEQAAHPKPREELRERAHDFGLI